MDMAMEDTLFVQLINQIVARIQVLAQLAQ